MYGLQGQIEEPYRESTKSNTPPLSSHRLQMRALTLAILTTGMKDTEIVGRYDGRKPMLRSDPILSHSHCLHCNRCKDSPPIHNGMQLPLQLQKEPSYAHKEPVYHPPSPHAPCSYTSDQPSAMAMAMAKAVVSATCEGEKVSAFNSHAMPKIYPRHDLPCG